ncbi:MAG TPA: DUF3106 domain-containing protein [Isosphaeraceae bacterium]|nr:DUF3106 domain-containing protein [Isosphaeraceae bacterium]
MRAFLPRPLLLLPLLLAPLSAVHAGELEVRQDRLQSMPREHRLALAETLKSFDALPPEERERIRTLDQKMQDLPAADRQRLYMLMRSYHDWLASLPEPTRKKIQKAPAADRIALINEIRTRETRSNLKRERAKPAIQVSSLVGEMPRQIAVELRFWFSLSPEERATLLKQPSAARQRSEFLVLIRKSEHFKEIQGGQERQVRKEVSTLRENMKNRQPELIARLRPFEIPKNPPRDRVDSLRRAVELFFLSEFEPEPVSLRNLARFEAAIPPWVRADAIALPPDAARRRLVILYRLTFPAPEELPEPAKPATGSRNESVTAPSATSTAPSNPF